MSGRGSPAPPRGLGAWLDRRTAEAPEALRAKVYHYAAAAGDGPRPETLARAGWIALEGVLAHPGDRGAALDLLAADALVTLALLAQAEANPRELGAFAERLLREHLPRA